MGRWRFRRTRIMKAIKGIRKGLLICGVILLVMAGLLAVFPAWASLALRPVARHFGFAYANYERIGYKRFALNNARYKTPSIEFTAKRIEGFLPATWIWS